MLISVIGKENWRYECFVWSFEFVLLFFDSCLFDSIVQLCCSLCFINVSTLFCIYFVAQSILIELEEGDELLWAHSFLEINLCLYFESVEILCDSSEDG